MSLGFKRLKEAPSRHQPDLSLLRIHNNPSTLFGVV